jgi:aminoglycoside phosphotransferase (APT) family kinase protein
MSQLHDDEITVDTALAGRLLADQLPQWAHLPLRPVASAGTDNWLLRLGTELVVRLPRHPGAVEGVAKEQRWLRYLAPQLPVAIPTPLAAGVPGRGYPWPWSVYAWLDGEHPTRGDDVLARDLAAFIVALQAIPVPGDAPQHYRGGPLADLDDGVREFLPCCEGLIDSARSAAAWDEAMALPPGPETRAWFHGDLKPDNLLTQGGRLSAVIDFGGVAAGDPAVDQIVAWTLFDAGPRETFRRGLHADDLTWARGRGWALGIAVVALGYYRDSNPGLAATSIRQVEQVLADYSVGR